MTIFTKNEIKSRILAKLPDIALHRVDDVFIWLEELGVIVPYTRKNFHIYLLDESSYLWRELGYNTVGRR